MRVLALVDGRWTDVVRVVRVEGTVGCFVSLVEILAYQSEEPLDMDELLFPYSTSITGYVSLDATPQQSGTRDAPASAGSQLPTFQDGDPANEWPLSLEVSNVSGR